jgi:hypothetical protein
MGVIGKFLGDGVGKLIGKVAGDKLGKYTNIHGAEGSSIGGRIGGALGNLLPFKKGGPIKKNGPIYGHKGEFVLPPGIEPTDYQLKLVKKRGGLAPKKPVNMHGVPVKKVMKKKKKSKK